MSSRRYTPQEVPRPEHLSSLVEYKLPKRVEIAVQAWTSGATGMAVVTALFATCETQLLSTLPTRLPESAPSSPAELILRFLIYTGLYASIGATISSFFLLIQAAALPEKAYVLSRSEKSLPYRFARFDHASGDSERLMSIQGNELLRQFGMNWTWSVFCWHSFLCFIVSCVCIFTQLAIYMWMQEKGFISGPLMISFLFGIVPVFIGVLDSLGLFHHRQDPV